MFIFASLDLETYPKPYSSRVIEYTERLFKYFVRMRLSFSALCYCSTLAFVYNNSLKRPLTLFFSLSIFPFSRHFGERRFKTHKLLAKSAYRINYRNIYRKWKLQQTLYRPLSGELHAAHTPYGNAAVTMDLFTVVICDLKLESHKQCWTLAHVPAQISISDRLKFVFGSSAWTNCRRCCTVSLTSFLQRVHHFEINTIKIIEMLNERQNDTQGHYDVKTLSVYDFWHGWSCVVRFGFQKQRYRIINK